MDAAAPESAAASAGLLPGDVLVEMGGYPLADWQSLARCLAHFRAGDTVTVQLWRSGGTLELPLTFGRRQPDHLLLDDQSITQMAREVVDHYVPALRQILDSATESESGFQPESGEWSVKQQLVDLSLTLRGMHEDIPRYAAGEALLEPGDEAFTLRQGFLAALPIRDLEARLAADLQEIDGQVRHLLAGNPAPGVRRYLAESLHFTDDHLAEHIERIRRVLAEARSAGH